MGKKFLFWFFVIISFDQGVKYLVEKFLFAEKIIIIPHFLILENVHNRGYIFGWFISPLIYYFLLAMVFLLFFYLWKKKFFKDIVRKEIWLAFIYGGGISNLADRLFRGYIVDFIKVPFWSTFNTADIFIVFGILIIAHQLIFSSKRSAGKSFFRHP